MFLKFRRNSYKHLPDLKNESFCLNKDVKKSGTTAYMYLKEIWSHYPKKTRLERFSRRSLD